MGHLFDWLKSPGGLIDYLVWHHFQENLSGIVLLTVILTLAAILLAYAIAARSLRIELPGDVFRSYTPLYWLLLSVAAGLIDAILCISQLSFLVSLGTKVDIALEVFFITAGTSALLAYLLILFVQPLTPARFRYRPASFLYRD
ncbi:hypothetical protein [Paracidobacterium acidisoli]|uniref:Uncharacterized protein n=1 Tax=Paracidobacterium acidisoli TaxID=2303751 RepID=A0A372IJ61_9BACT|nr:hypothetical protein [Paracidobacterium acidisoli]MBT9333147.1 hypothetical protein [Paracidobacterium acidisoli]